MFNVRQQKESRLDHSTTQAVGCSSLISSMNRRIISSSMCALPPMNGRCISTIRRYSTRWFHKSRSAMLCGRQAFALPPPFSRQKPAIVVASPPRTLATGATLGPPSHAIVHAAAAGAHRAPIAFLLMKPWVHIIRRCKLPSLGTSQIVVVGRPFHGVLWDKHVRTLKLRVCVSTQDFSTRLSYPLPCYSPHGRCFGWQ